MKATQELHDLGLQRLHDAAGITAARDEVAAGHHVVRQIAASGRSPVRQKRNPGAVVTGPFPRTRARRRRTRRD